MFRYVIVFSKTGLVRYISHLDMLRLFKRAFRRAGIDLAYSQGFNPHPKMSFAQPLSLGYDAEGEYLEFETGEPVSKTRLLERLPEHLPEGISITACGTIPKGQKSLAAKVYAAEYEVVYPASWHAWDFPAATDAFMTQEEILVEKRQKKSKKLKTVNIRPGIRSMEAIRTERNRLCLRMCLDCGNESNVSPELVIPAYASFADIHCKRHEIEVCRKKLILPLDFPIEWM